MEINFSTLHNYKNHKIVNLRKKFINEVCKENVSAEDVTSDDYRPDGNDYVIYTAYSNNDVLGYIIITDFTITIKNGLHISEIYVNQRYRNQGIGKSLVKYMLNNTKTYDFELCPADKNAELFWENVLADNKLTYKNENGFITTKNN